MDKKKTFRVRVIALSLLLFAVSSLTSCVPLAIGAAGGYILNEQGYKLQSPVTKEHSSSPDYSEY